MDAVAAVPKAACYRVLAELGRGAQGHVYLATQSDLGDRPVVLKVTRIIGEEHVALARLPHPHIVPLYNCEENRERGLRQLCMPYRGGLTWHSLFVHLAPKPLSCRTGLDLLEAIEAFESQRPLRCDTVGPWRSQLASDTYVQAICRLGACVAETLHFAHSHGYVHLDIKPDNLLLAADGAPLLLDFHLARKPLRRGEPPPRFLGGTPYYMPPEQMAALEAVKGPHPLPFDVDARADVYALGVVLFEALGGTLPRAVPLDRLNPQVSVGLADIIHRAIETDCERRYPDAASLAEDLTCHLHDRPLRGVPNRSWKERWTKWRRRRPLAMTMAALVGGLCLAALIAGGSLMAWSHQAQSAAENALWNGQEDLRAHRFEQALGTFARGYDAVDGVWGQDALRQSLHNHLQLARRGMLLQQIHKLADELRTVSVQEEAPRRLLLVLDAAAAELWRRRSELIDSKVARLEPELEEQARQDLVEIAVLWGDLRMRAAQPGERREARAAARRTLEEADHFSPKNLAIKQALERLENDFRP